MEERPARDGHQGFIADLADAGVVGTIEGAVVVYPVVAVGGRRAGQEVLTGVALNELRAWPGIPPHWIHFPADVSFAETNADPGETLSGWLRHSRDVGQWDLSIHPAHAWLAHVRSVVSLGV